MEESQDNHAPFGLFLTRGDLAKLFKLREQTISMHVQQHLFPQPILIGRSKRWRLSDIQNYLEQQAVASNSESCMSNDCGTNTKK